MNVATDTLLSLLQAHPYLLIFPLVVVEGSATTVCAGVLASTGIVAPPVAFAIVVAADLASDSLYYLLGRRSRRLGLNSRLLRRLGLTRRRLESLESSFKRNDGRALVGAKFLDFAAVPVFVAAGFVEVRFSRFMAWSSVAAMVKTAGLLALGYFFGAQVLQRLEIGTNMLIAISLALIASFVLYKLATRLLGRKSAGEEDCAREDD